MISRSTKVGTMLKEYPQTIEVLLESSAHFSKLQNPLLRKTLAPRVSIEQAAKIAGVNLSELLQALNKKIGATMPVIDAPSAAQQPQHDAKRPEILNRLQPVELDVRPILQGGTDPLKTIMKAVDQLAANQYLHLINSFEPIPLYAVLGKRGFDHFTEFLDGTFHVYFYRQMPVTAKMPPAPSSAEVPAREKTVELDVRTLSPPEPMMRILEILGRVDEKTLLFVHHHREPLFLYEKLQERGFRWNLKKIDENDYHLNIWKEEKVMTEISEQPRPAGEPLVLDVCELPPAKRHPLIFQTFEGLPAGKSFILVNDHDPKPLYYQFKFEQEGRFTWEYLEQGPSRWRVAIGKVGMAAS